MLCFALRSLFLFRGPGKGLKRFRDLYPSGKVVGLEGFYSGKGIKLGVTSHNVTYDVLSLWDLNCPGQSTEYLKCRGRRKTIANLKTPNILGYLKTGKAN